MILSESSNILEERKRKNVGGGGGRAPKNYSVIQPRVRQTSKREDIHCVNMDT